MGWICQVNGDFCALQSDVVSWQLGGDITAKTYAERMFGFVRIQLGVGTYMFEFISQDDKRDIETGQT